MNSAIMKKVRFVWRAHMSADIAFEVTFTPFTLLAVPDWTGHVKGEALFHVVYIKVVCVMLTIVFLALKEW